jgi:ketosteroid isomerase-like protein
MKTLLSFVLVGLAIGFSATVLAQEQNRIDAEVRQQIEAVDMKFAEAYNKHDTVASAAFYTQNAVQVSEWELGNPALGQKAIEERYSLDFASHPTECTGELVQMYAIGDEILATWHWGCGPSNGYSVKIYVRDADTWKIRMEYVILGNGI